MKDGKQLTNLSAFHRKDREFKVRAITKTLAVSWPGVVGFKQNRGRGKGKKKGGMGKKCVWNFTLAS